MPTYRLPIYSIVVTTDEQGGGTITSALKDDNPYPVPVNLEGDETMNAEYSAAMDAIESMILACACNGIDITRPEFVGAVENAVDACANHFE